jgi:hypothetical protein
VLEAQERESLGASGETRDPGLVGVRAQPEHVQDRRHQRAGPLGPLAGGAWDHQIIRVPHQHPEAPPAALPRPIEHVQGDVGEGGEIGEPCGVPASIADTIAPSNTPARSQPRSSLSIRRSHTRRSI